MTLFAQAFLWFCYLIMAFGGVIIVLLILGFLADLADRVRN